MKGLGTAAVMGIAWSSVTLLQTFRRDKEIATAALRELPEKVAGCPDLAVHLVALAKGVPHFRRREYRKLAKRIDNMLFTAQQIHQATPSTVDAAVVRVGAQMLNAVLRKLQTFYDACGVLTVRTRDELIGLPTAFGTSGPAAGVGAVVLEPMKLDLRSAHRSLVEVLFHISNAMADTAREKRVAAVVEKYTM